MSGVVTCEDLFSINQVEKDIPPLDLKIEDKNIIDITGMSVPTSFDSGYEGSVFDSNDAESCDDLI